jgi:hypothetical protein
MQPVHLVLLLAGVALALFVALRHRESDESAWWLGVIHAAVGSVALLGLVLTQEVGFAVSMGLLAAYGWAMAAARLARMLFASRRAI